MVRPGARCELGNGQRTKLENNAAPIAAFRSQVRPWRSGQELVTGRVNAQQRAGEALSCHPGSCFGVPPPRLHPMGHQVTTVTWHAPARGPERSHDVEGRSPTFSRSFAPGLSSIPAARPRARMYQPQSTGLRQSQIVPFGPRSIGVATSHFGWHGSRCTSGSARDPPSQHGQAGACLWHCSDVAPFWDAPDRCWT